MGVGVVLGTSQLPVPELRILNMLFVVINFIYLPFKYPGLPEFDTEVVTLTVILTVVGVPKIIGT